MWYGFLKSEKLDLDLSLIVNFGFNMVSQAAHILSKTLRTNNLISYNLEKVDADSKRTRPVLFGGDMGIIYDEIVGTLPDLLFPIIFRHENADQTIDMKDCNA